jgi:hypothetical protein
MIPNEPCAALRILSKPALLLEMAVLHLNWGKKGYECYREWLLKKSLLVENGRNLRDTKCPAIREDRL